MNLIGQKFGLYTVVDKGARTKDRATQWECECACGTKRIVPQRNLLNGNSKSCGCSKKALITSGQRYGRLVLVKPVGIKLTNANINRPNCKRRIPMWECQCDCGKSHVVSVYALRQGSTTSCGCLRDELRSERSSLPPGEASRNIVVSKYKRDAKNRNLVFNLSKEQCFKLFAGDCHYCGTEPSNKATYRPGATSFTYNGIDRIDSSKGYEPSNVVSCCRACNNAKMVMSQLEFAVWIQRVDRHWAAVFSANS